MGDGEAAENKQQKNEKPSKTAFFFSAPQEVK